MATILLKRGLASNVDNVELLVGEPCVTTDTGEMYVGTASGKVKIGGSSVEPPVKSVNGKTGVVTITKADIGLSNVNNTADNVKNVSSATKLTTARTIEMSGVAKGSASFDGSKNVTIIVDIDGGTF